MGLLLILEPNPYFCDIIKINIIKRAECPFFIMQSRLKILIGVLVAVLVGAVAFFFVMNNSVNAPSGANEVVPPPAEMPMMPTGNNVPANSGEGAQMGMPVPGENMGMNGEMVVQATKEFTMTSYYDPQLQKPLFSLKEMTVEKGDLVRIKVTNTLGAHDFTLDEYGIHEATPLNQEVVIEFTADKAGEFVYYCSMPGHRANGQWGTLRVTE